MTELFPFGVRKHGCRVSFCVYRPQSRTVSAVLYHRGESSSFYTLDLTEDSVHAGIFRGSMDCDPEVTEYLYADEAGLFVDPYASSLVYPNSSGAEESSVRCSIANFPAAGDDGFTAPEPADMIVYKLHVKGFTAAPGAGVKNPGTFKGLIQKLPYISSLGFNTILLMPCYDFDEMMDERAMIADGVRLPEHRDSSVRYNRWGYGAPAAYLAPKSSYAADREHVSGEFATLIKRCHKAGIAVTMELCFAQGTRVGLMLDTMRSWAHNYGVDGFRLIGCDIPVRVFTEDPYLNGVYFLSSDDGYQTTVRRFIKGDEGMVGEFAEALRTVSRAAIRLNSVADHDGFTLADTYSYDERHNEANGEHGRDGREINHSWNCGVEGPATSKRIKTLRVKMIKNALATLFLSQGTPMLMAGDEFGNSHLGNNNPYCLEGEQAWVNWSRGAEARTLSQFTADMIALRKAHRVFSNVRTLAGTDYINSGRPDISFHGLHAWQPDMGHFVRTLGVLYNGAYAVREHEGCDGDHYVIFNMHWEEHTFDLPCMNGDEWKIVISTDSACLTDDTRSCTVAPRSVLVLERHAVEQCDSSPARGKRKRR